MTSIFTLTGRPAACNGPQRTVRIRIDNTFDLNLFPDPQGNLVMTGKIRLVGDTIDHEKLHKLLQLNNYFPSIHQISVGILQENQGVQVWSRHPMHKMQGKEALRMLKLMATAVSHVNTILTT